MLNLKIENRKGHSTVFINEANSIRHKKKFVRCRLNENIDKTNK